ARHQLGHRRLRIEQRNAPRQPRKPLRRLVLHPLPEQPRLRDLLAERFLHQPWLPPPWSALVPASAAVPASAGADFFSSAAFAAQPVATTEPETAPVTTSKRNSFLKSIVSPCEGGRVRRVLIASQVHAAARVRHQRGIQREPAPPGAGAPQARLLRRAAA